MTELNTSTTPPTVVEDALFVDFQMDTFNPLVGIARDGTAFC